MFKCNELYRDPTFNTKCLDNFSGNQETECYNTKFPLATHLYVRQSVKLKKYINNKKISCTLLWCSVTRTRKGWQREGGREDVKTLRAPLSAKIQRHCVLSGGRTSTARFSSTTQQRNENINLNIYFIYPSSGSNSQPVYIHLRHDWPHY